MLRGGVWFSRSRRGTRLNFQGPRGGTFNLSCQPAKIPGPHCRRLWTLSNTNGRSTRFPIPPVVNYGRSLIQMVNQMEYKQGQSCLWSHLLKHHVETFRICFSLRMPRKTIAKWKGGSSIWESTLFTPLKTAYWLIGFTSLFCYVWNRQAQKMEYSS